MAIKKKRSKKVTPKKISSKVKQRLIAIRGNKGRRFKDPKTGRTYSRRQAEKGKVKKPRANIQTISIKQQKYLTMRDIFIKTQKQQGIKWTKREAMQSDELKKIIRGLHNKNKEIRSAAWDLITDGVKAEWVPYIQRWQQGQL